MEVQSTHIMRMRTVGRGSAADMEGSTESLKVCALKWLADTGKLEQLQHQCKAYTSEAETVGRSILRY